MAAAELSAAPPSRRVEAIDLARGFALLAMAIYHFTWDLEFFGYVEPGMTAVGGWRLFARCIASSFLFLVGVSLWMAHGRGIRWNGFWRRFAMVAGAAAAITIATWFAVPDAFIFFGILHQIAFASLAGLLFLRLPVVLVLVAAVAVVALPMAVRFESFDHWALWWLGLAPVAPRSNDFVPVFPFFAAVLFGIAAARLATASGLLETPRTLGTGTWSRPFRFAGKHSLAVYLIHQPILIGLVFLVSQVMPPQAQLPEVGFARACEAQCVSMRDATFCSRYCACLLDRFSTDARLDEVLRDRRTPTPPMLPRPQHNAPRTARRSRRNEVGSLHGKSRGTAADALSMATGDPDRLRRGGGPARTGFAAAWIPSPLADILLAIGWLLLALVAFVDIRTMMACARRRRRSCRIARWTIW